MSSMSRTRSRLGPGTKGALPNLVIIGGQKCGTTSLHYYLGLHPEIAMSRTKELDFFIETRGWPHGIDWYAAQFDSAAPIRGEASPAYTIFPLHQGVPERMHSVLPDAKLVYLVRDPIDRIVSNYVHDVGKRLEARPLDTVLNDPAEHRYVARSRYFMQLEQYLAFFPLSRILVLSQEELLNERARTLKTTLEFLGVSDADFSDPRFARIRHRSSHRRRKTELGARLAEIAGRAGQRVEVPDWLAFQAGRVLLYPLSRRVERPVVGGSLRQRLGAVLREDVACLRELTGKTFPEWSL